MQRLLILLDWITFFIATASNHPHLLGLPVVAPTSPPVFDGMESIKICDSYDNSDEFFEESLNLDHVKPHYIELSGWNKPIYGLKNLDDFPREAVEFISKIEEVCGVTVDIISTGPERESTIFKNNII